MECIYGNRRSTSKIKRYNVISMKYPKFFNNIETIKLKDELSSFLGTFENGLIEFNYLDIVKNAGHSCPTVAGAYLMTLQGLKELYKDKLPIRGEIYISFKEDATEGVAGVISNVITHITGATTTSGFKGIGDNFIRHSLMEFNADIKSSVKFQRLDNGKSVEVIYNPNSIKPNPKQQNLMQKIMQGKASNDERLEFGELWQERVENIFKNIEKVINIK